jgi:transmembrane sensor
MSRQRPPTTPPPSEQKISEEAAEWYLRMSSAQLDPKDGFPNTIARNVAFRKWYLRSAQHLHAFLDICEIHHVSQNVDSGHAVDIQELFGDGKDIVMARSRRPIVTGTAPPPARRSAFTYFARAAALILFLSALFLAGERLKDSPEYYATKEGEREIVTLEDGTTLTLNSSTRLSVVFGLHRQEVQIFSGEVLFDVRHDVNRPFKVVTRGIVLEDLGTQFDVYAHQTGTTISVLNGRVRLSCECVDGASGATSKLDGRSLTSTTHSVSGILGPNDQAEVTSVGGTDSFAAHVLTPDQLHTAIAWRDGEIIFDNLPLARAVEESNRYNRQKLVIDDASIVALPVTGHFTDRNINSFPASVSKIDGVEATMAPSTGGGIAGVIHLRAKGPAASVSH